MLLLFALLLGMGTAWAYSFSAVSSTGQTLYYTITDSNNHYVSVVAPGGNTSSGWNNYTKPTGVVDIPTTVVSGSVTYTVTSIGNYAFYGCSELTEVTIPEGITTIGGNAFWNCPGIETVHFNATNCTSMVTSNVYSVFNSSTSSSSKSNIKTITIGDNVTRIPDYAFRNAQDLHGSLSVPASVVSIGNYAFYNCVSLNFLNLEQGLVTIGNKAFYYCQVLEGRFQQPRGLYIPHSVTTVGEYAFFHCVTLPRLRIGRGVTSIGGHAFWECSSLHFVIFDAMNCTSMQTSDGGNTYSVFGQLHTASSNYPPIDTLSIGLDVTRIPDYAFSECSRITKNYIAENNIVNNLTLPNNLTYIGDHAFNWCSGYSGSLTVTNAVTSIGNYAFNNCSGFSSLGIGSSVATIGNYAFNECTGISGAVTVPNATTTIGDYAFYHCSSISTLTLGTGVATIGDYAFWYCPSLATVHFNPTNCTEMYTLKNSNYYSVFNVSTSVSGATPIVTLTIGSNVTRIPDYAFRNSTNMTSTITIPNATTYVGQYSFYGARSAELTIGTGVATIGGYAFWYCPNLATVHFNATNCTQMYTANTTSSSEYSSVFRKTSTNNNPNTTAIVTLTIGSNVTRIPNYAFRRSSEMTSSVSIPDACTYLGSYSFANSSGHDIFTGKNVTVIQDHTFYDSPGFDGSITLGGWVTAINEYAFYNCSGLNGGLVFPETLVTIGNYSFYSCNGLTGNLVFPDALTSIGSSAFYDCHGFDGDLVIPNAVTTLGTNAFQNCTGFDGSLVLGAGLTSVSNYTFDGCNGFTGALILGVNIESIGNYSFQNCSGFTSIITTHTPAFPASSNSFNSMNFSIPCYTPYGEKLNYQSKTGWSNFSNFVNQCLFVGYTNNLWSTAGNWSGSLPTSTDVVCINEASCQLNIDAQVRYLYVMNINQTLTVNSGKSLNTTYGVGTLQPSQLVVEDGGSLYNPISNAYGTIKKNITAYSGSSGWYTLSTPIHSGTATSFFSSGTYDLYYYDEPTHYWRNKKKSSNNFTKLQPAQGCLYAHSTAQTLEFAGEINASNKEFEVPITHDGLSLAGYNLIGNPYTHNLNISDVKINGVAQSSYYKIVNGSNLVAYTSNDPIGPCESFMVVAPNAGTLTFTHSRERSVEPMLRFVLSQGGADNEIIEEDRAYLRMEQGESLEKMTLPGAQSLLYFKQDDGCYAVANSENRSEAALLCLEVYNSGNYTIEAELLNTASEYLHLIDMETGDDIDLLATPRYSFEAVPSANPCRFALTFTPNASLPEQIGGDRGRGFQLPSHNSGIDQNAYLGENCTITVTANPTNGGTVTGGGTYEQGQQCTITATANTGYSFSKWTRNGTQVSTNASYTFTVTASANYVAVFTPNSYTITATANPTAGGTVSGAGTYNYNTNCTLTATPATGYSFLKWTKNGSQVSTNATYTFTVTGNASYVAVFTPQYTISASANPTAGGTVTGAGAYSQGASCTLTATAAAGYTFTNWTENGNVVSTNASYAFTVTSNRTLVANFTAQTYTITTTTNPAGIGSTTGGGTFNYGATCTLHAYYPQGYSFVNWTKNGTQVSTEATYTFTVTESANYVANFTLNTYTITVTANPTAGGTISGTGTYEHGSTCTLTAAAAAGYSFTNWTENGNVVSSNASYAFTVTSNRTLVANFTAQTYTITTTTNPAGIGSVTGGGTFNYGATCTLRAYSATGYSFVNWTKNGTVVSTSSTFSFTVTASGDYVANYNINTYDVTVSASPANGGSVSGGGTYNYGTSCTLTATPAEGYVFSKWTRNGYMMSTNPTYTFTVTGSDSYVAVFTDGTYEIAVTASPSIGGTVTGTGTYGYGVSCTLTAFPNTDFVFDNWTENGTVVSSDASYTFTVTSSRMLTANFTSTGAQHTREMAAGWNWWSTYIDLSSIDGLTMLEEALGNQGLSIVSQNNSIQNYYPTLGYNYWFGSLQSLQNESGYKVNASAACNVTMSGSIADPSAHPITIQPNWNWIGYPSSIQQSLVTALANYTPSANDVIKNQNSSATYYDGYGWFPETFVLAPGQCYMYKSTASVSKTMTFVNGRAVEAIQEVQRHWNNDTHAYADNLSMIAVVLLNGEEQRTDELELGAFVEGECRGSAVLRHFEPTDRWYAVLTVTGEESEQFSFGLIDRNNGEIVRNHDLVTFHANAVVGSLDHPYVAAFNGTTGMTETTLGQMCLYPNPIERNATFALEIPENELVEQVMAINALGEIVWRKTGSIVPTKLPGLAAAGVYTLKVVCRSGNTYTGRLIVK